MLQKKLDEISAQDIQDLIAARVRESRTLEYKEKLPGRSDGDKKEFLADVSSFANASGGDLLYGVSELRGTSNAKGEPQEAIGLETENIGAEIQRLESTIRDGIEPRILGLQLRSIEGFPNGRPVLIIRIPRSWSGPHMVKFSSRFYSRTSAGKYPLNVSELRAAFVASEELPERMRRFRDDRLGKIIADETPVPMASQHRLVLHLLPTASFTAQQRVDVLRILDDPDCFFPPVHHSGFSQRINLDGVLFYDSMGKGADAWYYTYAQVFRSGILEAVNSHLLSYDGKRLPARGIEQKITQAIQRYIKAYRAVQVDPPIVAMLSLLSVKGFYVQADEYFWGTPPTIDRDTVVLPEVVIDDFATPVEAALKPIYDSIWQSVGVRGSPSYSE